MPSWDELFSADELLSPEELPSPDELLSADELLSCDELLSPEELPSPDELFSPDELLSCDELLSSEAFDSSAGESLDSSCSLLGRFDDFTAANPTDDFNGAASTLIDDIANSTTRLVMNFIVLT